MTVLATNKASTINEVARDESDAVAHSQTSNGVLGTEEKFSGLV